MTSQQIKDLIYTMAETFKSDKVQQYLNSIHFCNGGCDGEVKLKRLGGIKKYMESNCNLNTKYYKYMYNKYVP